jgi:hypothetical protein
MKLGEWLWVRVTTEIQHRSIENKKQGDRYKGRNTRDIIKQKHTENGGSGVAVPNRALCVEI